MYYAHMYPRMNTLCNPCFVTVSEEIERKFVRWRKYPEGVNHQVVAQQQNSKLPQKFDR